jgi:hypothetical protein
MEHFGQGLTENTLKLYTNNLKRLNGGVMPTSLTFLKNIEKIENKLEGYSPNTKKSYYITIVSALKDKKIPKKTLQYYVDRMTKFNNDFNEHKGEKTEKQEKNWISWEEVMKIYSTLTPRSIEHLALSLYVLQPPRRNKDFSLMKVVPEWDESMDKEFNYLSWDTMKMYFNNYKTAGTYGTQTIETPHDLQTIIKKHYPFKKKFEPFFLLHNKNNIQLSENGLTRIMNKIFGKKISVSMLRNIFLTEKFGGKKSELQNIASSMGTSPAMVTDVYTKD